MREIFNLLFLPILPRRGEVLGPGFEPRIQLRGGDARVVTLFEDQSFVHKQMEILLVLGTQKNDRRFTVAGVDLGSL